ncbi:ribonuclease J, partial [Mesorhizobium sp. M00.F.Ca.ET.186.01.1.1]
PINNQAADLAKMAMIGDRGVLCLLSDSTNAERPGFTGSERSVGIAIKDVFSKATGRIVVSTFASNVHRIQQVVDAAVQFNRKLTVVGRSMQNVMNISRELGYLFVPDGLIVESDEINKLPAEQVVILSTGS